MLAPADEKFFYHILLVCPMNLLVVVVGLMAGLVGALMGLGGGVIMVPALTAILGVDVKEAVATSSLCTIATSIAGAARYVKQGLTNIKLALFLNTTAVAGAVTGALLAVIAPRSALYLILSAVLAYLSASQVATRRREEERIRRGEFAGVGEDGLARLLGLSDSYYDAASKVEVRYSVRRTPIGLVVSYLAGLTSGLLGIGGGVLKVPIMNQVMNVPIKASIATSKFMIGITASASATVYLMRGLVNTLLAAPLALGVILGATLGAQVMNRIRVRYLKTLFGGVLVYFSYAMLAKFIFLTMGAALPGVRL